jgi:hypothetical protein
VIFDSAYVILPERTSPWSDYIGLRRAVDTQSIDRSDRVVVCLSCRRSDFGQAKSAFSLDSAIKSLRPWLYSPA